LNFVRIYTKEIPMHYLREQALARGFCNRWSKDLKGNRSDSI
jgi:hypothetical protein